MSIMSCIFHFHIAAGCSTIPIHKEPCMRGPAYSVAVSLYKDGQSRVLKLSLAAVSQRYFDTKIPCT